MLHAEQLQFHQTEQQESTPRDTGQKVGNSPSHSDLATCGATAFNTLLAFILLALAINMKGARNARFSQHLHVSMIGKYF